jgi:hypothetical protein
MLGFKQSRHYFAAGRAWRWRRRVGQCFVLACCAALAVAAGLLRGRAQSAPAPQKAASAPAAPDGQPSNPQNVNPVEAARHQQMARQCADLLKMAMDLKAEVDKSNKDQLSLSVVRKADEIEKLAHKVRTKNSTD